MPKCTKIRLAAGGSPDLLTALIQTIPDSLAAMGRTSTEDGRVEREERGDGKRGEGISPKVRVSKINIAVCSRNLTAGS